MRAPEEPTTATPADQESHRDLDAVLDALVLSLNEELSLLMRLHFRLKTLRFTLFDRDARFIQLAALDVQDATTAVVEHEGRTVEAIAAAQRLLGTGSQRVVDLAAEAPRSHRGVLVRLTREINTTSRALSALRDAVNRQSAAGRQAVTEVLDLTETGDNDAPAAPGRLFRGAF